MTPGPGRALPLAEVLGPPQPEEQGIARNECEASREAQDPRSVHDFSLLLVLRGGSASKTSHNECSLKSQVTSNFAFPRQPVLQWKLHLYTDK